MTDTTIKKYKPCILVNPTYNPIQKIDREYNKSVTVCIKDIPPNLPESTLNVYVDCTEPSIFCSPTENIKERTDLDLILTIRPELLENSKCKSVLFPFGTCWVNNIVEEKTFGVSFLITAPTGHDGYSIRHELWNLKDEIETPKKFYNSSRRPSPEASGAESIGNELSDKEKLFDNMFSIVIENTREPYYFSEKLIDCLQSKTVPIYYGCSRLEEFFNMDGVIVVNSAEEIVDACNSLTPEDYEKMKPAIEENYEKSCYYAIPFYKRLFDTIEKELELESTIEIKNNMKVSICMPTHEMNGKGKDFLEFSLNCIKQQTYKNIEVVISDQSTNDDIKNVCEKWKDDLDIKYLYFDGARRPSANCNNAMRNATGDIIKPMFLDDFFCNDNCIELFVDVFKSHPNNKWAAISFGHLIIGENDDPLRGNGILVNIMTPVYHEEIHRGRNTLGCPSVIAIKNSDEFIFFDDTLSWLMDTEYYKRLHNDFGSPVIIKSEYPSVCMRVHADSVSTSFNDKDNEKEKELQYVIEKIEGQEALK
jgi:hypothetical protein